MQRIMAWTELMTRLCQSTVSFLPSFLRGRSMPVQSNTRNMTQQMANVAYTVWICESPAALSGLLKSFELSIQRVSRSISVFEFFTPSPSNYSRWLWLSWDLAHNHCQRKMCEVSLPVLATPIYRIPITQSSRT